MSSCSQVTSPSPTNNNRSSFSFFFFFQLVLLLLLTVGDSSGLTVQVEPRTTECFFENFRIDTQVTIVYQVIRGGLLDVKFQIFSPDNQQLFETLYFEEEDEGVYDFEPKTSGDYSICFNNEMSKWTPKVVSFYMIIEDHHTADEKLIGLPAVAQTEDLNPVETSINRIKVEMEKLQRHQSYLRGREAQHRQVTISTTSRVVWLSFLEAVVLIGLNLGQIYYLRRFFEIRKVV